MNYLQIYTGMIQRSVETKAEAKLYAYSVLRAYSSSSRGCITRHIALSQLSCRMGRSLLTVRRLLSELQEEGWIDYYSDTGHYHTKSIDNVKMLVAPYATSATHKPTPRAMSSFKKFKDWCTGTICSKLNHYTYTKYYTSSEGDGEQSESSDTDCPGPEPLKVRLEARRKSADVGQIACRYFAQSTGLSLSTAWRRLKSAEESGFIKIRKKYCRIVDKMKIRTVSQLEDLISNGNLCGEDIHKHRFVYDEEMKRYRFIMPSFVDTRRINCSRRKIRHDLWEKIKQLKDLNRPAGFSGTKRQNPNQTKVSLVHQLASRLDIEQLDSCQKAIGYIKV